jgi:hypothetical protein
MRVFGVVNNGSSHRSHPSVRRLRAAFPNLVLLHGPVHASWHNQIEIYFSIVQRRALTPNDFSSLADVEARLPRFQQYYETVAKPFEWKFSRADLDKFLKKIDAATILAPSPCLIIRCQTYEPNYSAEVGRC